VVYILLKEVRLNMNEQPAATMPPQPPQAPALQYRSVGIRFIAILIDLIIVALISAFFTVPLTIPSSITVANVTNASVQSVSITTGSASAGSLISGIVLLVYFTVLLGTYGQTVGKMAVKIKVVKEDGTKITYVDAFVRTLLLYIDAFPYIIPFLLGAILIWTSDKKQRLGDRSARTIVVSA
jgi:uncharacterized RDD family membrane protein YckC